MTIPCHRFDYYCALHNDFNRLYNKVNKYAINLYGQPRKFIMETGPVLDKFIREHAVPGAPKASHRHSVAVFEFIAHLDDFTTETVKVFKEHMMHVEACKGYLKKVAEMEESRTTNDDYIRLTPVVLKLHHGLAEIKENADAMISRLEKLQLRWAIIEPVACL